MPLPWSYNACYKTLHVEWRRQNFRGNKTWWSVSQLLQVKWSVSQSVGLYGSIWVSMGLSVCQSVSQDAAMRCRREDAVFSRQTTPPYFFFSSFRAGVDFVLLACTPYSIEYVLVSYLDRLRRIDFGTRK